MIDVRTAIAMVEKKFPNKKMREDSVPAEWNGKYLFTFVDKDATYQEYIWDNGQIAVDKETGEISKHSVFDEDIFFGKVTPITEY